MLLGYESELKVVSDYTKQFNGYDLQPVTFVEEKDSEPVGVALVEKSSIPEDLDYLKVDFFNPYGSDEVDAEQERGAYFISAFTPRGVKDMGDCTKVVLFLDDLTTVRNALENTDPVEGLRELESNGVLVIY